MKMLHLSNHAILKFTPKNVAHLLTLTSDLGGFEVEDVNYMNAIDFSNTILSPEPANISISESISGMRMFRPGHKPPHVKCMPSLPLA
jgi:hypothetical protein